MVDVLEIKNFKSIKHLKLDCKRVNVFIGRPNTGKSNILESLGLLSFLYYARQGYEARDFVRFESTGMLTMSWMLSLIGVRPSKPDPIKKSIYECGFETLSGRWSQFNFRFYSFALLFVIFDVEVVFLFPWAASFGVLSRQFGAFVLVEMLVFIAVLLVGWLYAWRKGALEWG